MFFVKRLFFSHFGPPYMDFPVSKHFLRLLKRTLPDFPGRALFRLPGCQIPASAALTAEEMDQIRALDTGKGSHDPETPGMGELLLKNYRVHD